MIQRKRGKSRRGWLGVLGLLFIAVIAVVSIVKIMEGTNVAVLNPQGAVAAAQKDLLLFTLVLSAIVVVPVFIMIGVFAWRYREGNPKGKYTPDDDSNKWIESVWWGIPILIIGILSVVTWVTTHQLDPYKPLVHDEKPIKVQVIAMQWKWLFLYPEYDVASLNVLKMPVCIPVDFEITGDGPMSAMWIPNLGTQTYAMNGMTARLSLIADEPGVYRGSNSNISGEGYAKMHFNAETVPNRQAFEEWASDVRNDNAHDHMDSSVYEKLSRPSAGDKPQYYHLHDDSLYATVMNKYMHHGDEMTGREGNHDH